MHDKEKRIRDQRLGEAISKGLTGLDGKFGCIVRYLGTPIIAQGGSLYDYTPMPDVWALEEEEKNELPTMDEDESVSQTGWHFDGLTNGLHMEVKYLSNKKELTVTYKGYLVYSEVAGELDCYVPMAEWEEKVDKLYEIAKAREKKSTKQDDEDNRHEAKRAALGFLERLRLRWGV